MFTAKKVLGINPQLTFSILSAFFIVFDSTGVGAVWLLGLV